jgi:ferredoxin
MVDIVERRISGLTVRIKRNVCCATGNCMKIAGDVFEFDDERVCSFRPDGLTIDPDKLAEACRVCPVGALIVINEQGQQIVP